MDPLTLPRRAFHLALLAKTHVSTVVTICLDSIGREMKETERNACICEKEREKGAKETGDTDELRA